MNIFCQTIRRATRQTLTKKTPSCLKHCQSAYTSPASLAFAKARRYTTTTTPPKSRKYKNMAHYTTEELATSLQALGLENQLETYPNCYPQLNPVDVYRSHITTLLADITGADKANIYPNLQWTMTLDKGDLILPVAALRIKGKKPQDLAIEWSEKVASPTPLCA